jgi:hypothetical protein
VALLIPKAEARRPACETEFYRPPIKLGRRAGPVNFAQLHSILQTLRTRPGLWSTFSGLIALRLGTGVN